MNRLATFVRAHARILLGLAVSAACLYYLLRAVDWSALWAAFRQGRYLLLLPALVVLVGINLARSVRWRVLIGAAQGLSVGRLFSIVNIGYLFNNVLPAKAGEVVRAYLVGRIAPGGLGLAASTLVVERLLDVLTLVGLLFLLMPLVALPPWVTRAGLVFGAVAVGGTVALIVLARYGRRGVDWLWRFVGRLPLVGGARVRALVEHLVDGFGVLTHGRVLLVVLFWSVVVWAGYAVFNYILMGVFRLQMSLVAASTVLCATGFSMVLPSSPGAVGPFEYAAVLALSVFGVAQEPASAYAFGLHWFTNITLILFGLVGLRQEGLSFSSVRSRAAAGEADSPVPGATSVERPAS